VNPEPNVTETSLASCHLNYSLIYLPSSGRYDYENRESKN